MAETKKTDNHYLADKVALRVAHSPWLEDRPLKVLDAFGGKGVVWAAVQRKTGRLVKRTAIDKRHDLGGFHLHGDNIKVLAGLDLTQYDVVDLDAYGIPAEQLDIVLRSGFRGTVFVTAIQTMQGAMPAMIADEIGLPVAAKREAPSLIARRGWEYLKEWLCLRGVKRIVHRSKHRKHYFCFALNGVEGGAEGYGSPPVNISAGLF